MPSAWRAAWAGLISVFAAGMLNCAEAPRSSEPADAWGRPAARGRGALASVDSVILITLDGVRWQEVFGGVDARLAERARLPRRAIVGAEQLLPEIHALFFEGGTVLGDPRLPGGMAASGPRYVSLPGYVELITGARSACRENDCEPALGETLAEEIAGSAGGAPGASAVFASWERIGRLAASEPRRVHVRAGREPGEEGPPYPGRGDYRQDRFTAALAVRHLLEHRPRFLWIALGDTDEWAHRDDYRGYLDALRDSDAFIGEIAAHLDAMGEHGAATALLVTTDHGRDPGFTEHGGEASGATWLLARGATIPRGGAVGTRSRRHLRDVAPTVRAWLGLPPRACEGCGQPIEELLGAAAPLAQRGTRRAPN